MRLIFCYITHIDEWLGLGSFQNPTRVLEISKMNKYVDLHVHPLAEKIPENPLSASEYRRVVDQAAKFVKAASDFGLSAIAVTDHNTTVSVGPAQEAGEKYGVEIVPGVEITLPHMPHLLVYYPDLEKITADLTNGAFQKKRDSIYNELRRSSGNSGTPLWEMEGYDRTVREVIDLVKSYHGVVIQAHPQLDLRPLNKPIGYETELEWTKDCTDFLINAGIWGVEAYTPRHSKQALRDLETTLNSKDIIAAGGSDAHSTEEVGRIYFFPDRDIIRLDYKILERLKEAKHKILMEEK